MGGTADARVALSTVWLLAGLELAACAGARQPMRPAVTTDCHAKELDAEEPLKQRPDPAGPLCSREQLRSALEVDDLDDDYFEGAHYGQQVLLRGRAILGGVCCRGCWGGCAAAIALGSGPRTDPTPGAGRIVFLTDAQLVHRGQRFDDALWPGFTQSCHWSKDRYCCRSRRLGRDVVVTGRMISPPDVKLGSANEPSCSEFRSGLPPNSFPRCEFTVPWRSEVEGVAAVAVDSVCRVPDTTASD
jgi:hypothetical protein